MKEFKCVCYPLQEQYRTKVEADNEEKECK
jgi:hypothetical protein